MCIALYGDETTHPLGPTHLATLETELDALATSVEKLNEQPTMAASRTAEQPLADYVSQLPPRVVWVIADAAYQWLDGLTEQFTFLGLPSSGTTGQT